MKIWQQVFLLFYALLNLVIFLKGFYESKYKKNAYGLTRPLFFIGIFVWGDAVIFSLFWIMSAVVALILQDWYLFLLTTSVFWVIRSLGESIYWFNQQFSQVERNPIRSLPWHSIFHNDSVWFIYQIIWQCVGVASIILSIYYSWLWLQNLTI